MITAEIKMVGKDHLTITHGKTIEEVLEKIREYHIMDDVTREHYAEKGSLKRELKSGWWIAEK